MKRKIYFFIALIMCACSFTTAFASYTVSLPKGSAVYANPGDYASISQTIDADGVFTIVQEQMDASGNLWGRLKSGAGWVFLKGESALHASPVSVYFADEVLLAKESCNYLLADGSPNASEIAIFANGMLTDVCFSELAYSDSSWIENPLYNLPVLIPAEPIVAAVAFYGDNTAYGLSFTDEFGAQRFFSISISGVDGSLILTEQ